MAALPQSGMRWLLFSASGRLSRRTYAWALLFWTAVFAVPVSAAVSAGDDSSALATAGLGFMLTFAVAAWSVAVMSIKRLHDAGLPVILVVVLLVPAASLLMLIAIMVWPSVKGPNGHGPGPDQPGY
ncbi:DUF805 domain-containing protein [Hoeflea sp. G2-23]|uniref:DUF805 domain-containing protein n=1 Tax=Hoeflea algicola TaxID=2983763 RepID=A0ABT3ZCW6_9HYPH|nr:DUF805 domain-containing protein [Hoeflea algicola]MCY0149579.1 DUF805 domain-containing protein [Hoeflea algicola]